MKIRTLIGLAAIGAAVGSIVRDTRRPAERATMVALCENYPCEVVCGGCEGPMDQEEGGEEEYGHPTVFFNGEETISTAYHARCLPRDARALWDAAEDAVTWATEEGPAERKPWLVKAEGAVVAFLDAARANGATTPVVLSDFLGHDEDHDTAVAYYDNLTDLVRSGAISHLVANVEED